MVLWKIVEHKAAVTWLVPELVCNVKYTEFTKEGILRHLVFMGLRKDKAATEVNRADTDTVSRKGSALKQRATCSNLCWAGASTCRLR